MEPVSISLFLELITSETVESSLIDSCNADETVGSTLESFSKEA